MGIIFILGEISGSELSSRNFTFGGGGFDGIPVRNYFYWSNFLFAY